MMINGKTTNRICLAAILLSSKSFFFFFYCCHRRRTIYFINVSRLCSVCQQIHLEPAEHTIRAEGLGVMNVCVLWVRGTVKIIGSGFLHYAMFFYVYRIMSLLKKKKKIEKKRSKEIRCTYT